MGAMLAKLVWWFSSIGSMCVGAYLTHRINVDKSHWNTFWFILAGILMSLSWTGIARNSSNLLFDSLLFDIFIVLSYTFVLTTLGDAAHFKLLNWVGLIVAVSGIILMKIK